jgi:glycine dehydrogenase subunit 1
MSYVPHTDQDVARMLAAVGAARVEDLFADIPPEMRLRRPLRLPPPLTEHDLLVHLEDLARRNLQPRACFLGAGAYRHYIPSVVDTILSRSEFLTSYTPYQPEVSQGTLQSIFEFQSLVCRLTGMDVANASLYDGATAAAEAVLLARNHTGRRRVLVSRGVHPHTRQVLATYLPQDLESLQEIPLVEGATRLEEVGDDVACVLFQVPNFLGVVEDGPALCQAAARAGALAVVALGDPVSLALLAPPGGYGADLVVGEGQPLGLPPSFGGPYVGLFAARQQYLRRLPGRLVGLTADSRGQRAYCLTLQAREQHIRREKAASNICTNQGLCALAVTVYLSLLGPQGLAEVARACLSLAAFARSRLAALPGFSVAFPQAPVFHEFVLRCPAPPEEINRRLLQQGILGGYPLGQDYPELKDCMLVCCTEVVRAADIEALASALPGAAARAEESLARG